MTKLKFRSDINALRAIAVIGVVLYHFKVPYFQGGFSGVDIFFVISGYLMSKIIITDISQTKLSLSNFYGKRLKRIVPALLCMIAIVMLAGYFLFFPDDFAFNSKCGFFSLLFVSNMFYWKNSGYFDPSSETNVFLHTWSLSVEWQFYMLYPIVLLWLSKLVKKRSLFIGIFISATVLIIIASFVLDKKYSLTAFYLLPSRSWEMMMGGVAFLLEPYLSNIKFKKGYILLSYLVLLLGLVFLKDNMGWPYFYTLIPVTATFLTITLNNDFDFLKFAPVQFIGKISYSLYLWHWPVYVYFNYVGVPLNTQSILLMIFISMVLGTLSFRLIESRKYENNTRILVTDMALALVVCSFAYVLNNRAMFSDESLYLSTFTSTHRKERDKQFDEGCCFLNIVYDGDHAFDTAKCVKAKPNEKNYILIGDSHAAHFSQSLKGLFNKNNTHLIQATASRCFPVLTENGNANCFAMINYVYNDFIPKNREQIDGVIISANWYNYRVPEKQIVDDIKKTVDHIKKLNIKVVVIGQNEVYNLSYPLVRAKEIQYGTTLTKNFKHQKSFDINNYLKANLGADYINIINDGDVPPIGENNTPYMFDENHYTKYGADLILKRFIGSEKGRSFFGNDLSKNLLSYNAK
ncbi:acyltransferase [Mucilaginibacter sp. JRF]|uniref:acyltransferase family protein n=1 Tax=Mucilaginibacter sp. JRF TaxID=2780088 RepID=UPI001880AC3B|nr:acyltransferase family protein [Mucilaginibacter sp. JRF]MBE9585602.1 acyltransferase [Mucilaginibacter sp. JRF]